MAADDIAEEWRIIKEAPHYAVSNIGRVKRIIPDRLGRNLGRILRTPIGDAGYPVCSLHVNGKQLHRRIYKLVCAAFHGPRPSPKHETRHLDGDHLNSRADNLAWGTSKQNKADSLALGVIPMGEGHSAARLTEDNVREIRRGGHYRAIAAKFGISSSNVLAIRAGKSWKHLLESRW